MKVRPILSGPPGDGRLLSRNYPAQTQALQEGLSPYAKIDWTVIHEGGNGTRGKVLSL